jgi:magnesium-transporting ATPase (P-type)
MKDLLAFSVGGTDVQVPKEIQHILDANSGGFGANIIGVIIGAMFLIAIFMTLAFIILGGFKWITSQGDPKQLEGARNTIIYAAVGLGITLLSFFIVRLIGCFLNVPFFGNIACH